ncbi:hypothetical protein TNCV_2393841 [Trichonephila clavipes]|nr:hypothetical protein TNCV_2393841 [Trichonephila clavipes]
MKAPHGDVLLYEGYRGQCNCISRFANGHLKSLTFEQGLQFLRSVRSDTRVEPSVSYTNVALQSNKRAVLATDLGQGKRTTPELVPPSSNYLTNQREDIDPRQI